MGTTTPYLGLYLPADNEIFDEQANTNTSFTRVDSGVQVEHNGWTGHANSASPHAGHALLAANTFTGAQTVRVAVDTNGIVLDPGVLSSAGVQTGERLALRANSYDTGNHVRTFFGRARTTNNAGAGILEWATLLDAQSTPTVLWSVDQGGNVTTVGTQTVGGALTAASYAVAGGSSISAVGTGSIQVQSPTQYAMLSSRQGSHLAGNAYWDGTNWQRYDTAQASAVWVANSAGMLYNSAAAGSGTVPFSTKLSIDISGTLAYPGGGWIRDYGPGTGYVQINQLTVTPGVLAAAGLTVNGNSTVNGSETVTGNFTANGSVLGGSGVTSNGGIDSGNGNYYFAHNGGIYWTWTGYIEASHGIVSRGNIFGFNGMAAYWSWDGSWVRATGGSGIGTSGAYVWLANNSGVGLYWDGYLHLMPNALTSTLYLGNRGDVFVSWDGSHVYTNQHFQSGGVVCFAGNGGIYIYWDGAGLAHTHQVRTPGLYSWSGATINGDHLYIDHNLQMTANADIYWTGYGCGISNGSHVGRSGDTVYLYNHCFVYYNLEVGHDMNCLGGWLHAGSMSCNDSNNGGQFAFGSLAMLSYNGSVNFNCQPNQDMWCRQTGSSTWAAVHAAYFQSNNSVDHAVQYGLRQEPVRDALGIVKALTGYAYDHIWYESDMRTPLRQGDSYASHPDLGFKPSEVKKYLPEIVADDPESGEPISIDFGRMVPVLWEAVKELSDEVDALRAKVAA